MPSTPWAMQSRTCSSWRLASSLALRSMTVWPASLQRRGDRPVARHPELGLEVLEGEADGGGRGAAAGEGGAGEDGAGGEGLQSGHVVFSLSVVEVSGGFFGVADVLDGLEHRLGREDALEPVVAEDQRPRLGDGVQRAVGELALGEDAEGDGELDVEVAEDEVVRGLLAARRGGRPRRWPRGAPGRGWRRRSRRAPARGWRAARRCSGASASPACRSRGRPPRRARSAPRDPASARRRCAAWRATPPKWSAFAAGSVSSLKIGGWQGWVTK